MTERRRIIPQQSASESGPRPSDGVSSVTVHYGEEVFSPVQYNSFRIGGHSVTLTPLPGETASQCAARGRQILDVLADEEFAVRKAKFMSRVK